MKTPVKTISSTFASLTLAAVCLCSGPTVLAAPQASSAYPAQQGTAKDVASVMAQAKAGDANAQYELAVRYAQGNGVAGDAGQALFWSRKAAEQGHADAQFGLGGMYFVGAGVARDKQQAMDWFRRAAEQGQVGAQYTLGALHLRDMMDKNSAQGEGLLKNAMAILEKEKQAEAAGKKNAAPAKPEVVDSQEAEKEAKLMADIENDKRLAFVWLTLAERNGYQDKGNLLTKLKWQLSEEERNKFTAEADAWKPRR